MFPCKNCVPPIRHEGCWDTCDKYIEIREKLDKINENRHRQNKINDDAYLSNKRDKRHMKGLL